MTSQKTEILGYNSFKTVTVQNSAANLTLTATCVAAVVFRVFRRIPFTSITDFSTHNSSRIQKASLFHSTGRDDH
jgi:hypothetical protein